MPRIFWTPRRKTLLLQQVKSMTLEQLARHHRQPVAEIERMLRHLDPRRPLVLRTYRWKGHQVTVYYPGYALGVSSQHVGEHRALY